MQPNTSLEPKSNSVLNFAFGGISGAFGTIISHPFDTLKTYIQKNGNLNNFKYSFKSLYKGISTPIVGVGFEKAMVFGIYESANHLIGKYTNFNIPIAGALSGFGASVIVTPFERIKILLQTNNFDRTKCNFKYLYSGFSATLTRETPGFAIYFTVYEHLKSKYCKEKNITPHQSFVFGAIAGAISWVFIYPQDKIKTIIQSNKLNNNSFMFELNKIYVNEGLGGFYKGFHLALMRAIPLHAGTFMMMEFLKN